MDMFLRDITFSNISLLPPKLLENNHYSFPLQYLKDENELPFMFQSNQLYRLYIKNDLCQLHIKEKNELEFFNQLYEYLLNLLYDKHDNWFEHKFEKQKFKSMFKDYLYPNIQENAVNIKCTVDSELIKKITENNTYEIYPTFKLNSIIFNEIEFLIDLQLINATFLESEENNLSSTNNEKNETNEDDVEVSLPSVEENTNVVVENNSQNVENNSQNVENNSQNVENNSQNVENNSPDLEHLENTSNLNELEEIDINLIDKNEDMDVDLKESDYFIIFKIIQSNIKDNFSNTLIDLLNKRDITTKNIDIQSIVYDSDENEDSEDEYLNNDNFEESYKNIV